MIPRLRSSNKWTDFPKDYLSQIEDVFKQAFIKNLKNHKLIIQGRIYPEEILLRVGILESGRLAQANFEVSVLYNSKKDNALEVIHNCVDAAASMMQEYFEKQGEVDFPRSWKEYDFNKTKIFLQFSTVNTDLESQANALLGENFADLVGEEPLDEDAIHLADEKIDTQKPSIFSKKNKKLH